MSGWFSSRTTVFIFGVLLAAPIAGAIATTRATADETCTFEPAYSVDRGQIQRQGDTLIVEVWGLAPTDGWTTPKLAIVPEDTNAIAVAFRLMGCAPDHESGGLKPMYARAIVVANPGRIHSIIVRASTNDVRLQDSSL